MEAGDVALLRGLGCFWGLQGPSPMATSGAAALLGLTPPAEAWELAEPGDWETLLLGNQVYSFWALWAQRLPGLGTQGISFSCPHPQFFPLHRRAACSVGARPRTSSLGYEG